MGRQASGFLRYCRGRATAPCMVLHASAFGVRFEMADSLDLDGEFELRTADQPLPRTARVVWRQGGVVAAEFRPVGPRIRRDRPLLTAV